MSQVTGGGLVLLPAEARSIDFGGFDVLVQAESSDTGGAFSLIETREYKANFGPAHIERTYA